MKLLNIEKRYGEKQALFPLSLELDRGKITAVLGESGAGKTTLLNIISETVPHGGTVEGAGRISYLFQSPKLLPNLTVENNLKFVLPKSLHQKTGEILARVGLKDKEKEYPKSLSGGERQRVAIARAFVYPHDTLLMDEPFSSLDLSLKRSLLELVYELSEEQGNTVVFVTHDVHEAAILAHRAIVLQEGKLLSDLSVTEPFPRDFFKPSPVEETLMRALTRQIQS